MKMKQEQIYKEEQELLDKLVEAESSNDKEYKGALKRTIGRVNETLRFIDRD